MQNPLTEIAQAVTLITTAKTPDIQRDAIQRFFTADASFKHPICEVEPAENSREALIGIYQWYRVMSPNIEIKVNQTFYNSDTKTVVLDVSQKFHIRFSPFQPAPARLLVHLRLRKIGTKYYISSQEDFYHPDDFAALLIPPLVPFIRLGLRGASFLSGMNAKAAATLGVWAPGSKESKVD